MNAISMHTHTHTHTHTYTRPSSLCHSRIPISPPSAEGVPEDPAAYNGAGDGGAYGPFSEPPFGEGGYGDDERRASGAGASSSAGDRPLSDITLLTREEMVRAAAVHKCPNCCPTPVCMIGGAEFSSAYAYKHALLLRKDPASVS